MKSIIVRKDKNFKENIDIVSYLKNVFPNINKSVIFKALRKKDIKVNDKRVSQNITLSLNDVLDIYISDNILYPTFNIDVIYEDTNILVCYKPQGIISNHENENSLDCREMSFEELVKQKLKYKFLKICHRLDRNTAGLIIFAKNKTSYYEILKGFKNSNITKEYYAYVTNCSFKKDHEILEKYLLKDEKNGYCKVYEKKVNNSQKIITEYFVLKKDLKQDYACLKIIIHTGKTHQIRAQMKNISHSIIGDSKYGKNEVNKKFKKYKQMLYATNLKFNFNVNTYLSYLNKINIALDKKYYDNLLGSE